MRAVYVTDWDEDSRVIECEGFVETPEGVVLLDGDGDQVGYVSHRTLVAIEPAEKWGE